MMQKKISLFSLTVLMIAAIDSIRNLPSSALFGSSVIFFFIFGAIMFLIPTSLVAAELSATFPEKGGVYYWVNRAFGQHTAMLAIWLQWINTMIWYPTILSFIAGSIAYLFNPALATSPLFIVAIVVSLFWILTLINLFGITTSANINKVCALIGTIFPLILLIALAIIWLATGRPSQVTFSTSTIFPTWQNAATWVSLVSVMASFLGMELSGVHINDIHNPQRNFPKAVFMAATFILASMLFGSLAIAIVLPRCEINLIAGVLQVFSSFFSAFRMSWAMPILTLLIVVGSIGNMINWLIAPAKGLLHAAEFGFLPPFFTKKNQFGVASRILIAQAILVSLVCFVFILVPNVNDFYWFLTALSTGLYMMMYIIMFLSGIRLRYHHKERPKAFKIPGGNAGMWTTVILGIIGCAITITVGFFPADTLDVNATTYALMIAIGNLSMLAPVLLFFWYKKARS